MPFPKRIMEFKEAYEKIPGTGWLREDEADVVDCLVLDLWGDDKHYRVDGTFAGSHREKFFNLKCGTLAYYHPTIHAPKVKPTGREAIVVRFPMYVLHWGIMNMDDVKFHTDRWNRIYTKKVGANPYGFYPYLNDPNTVPILKDYDYDTWE